jgi:hypothetical protein
MVAAGNVASGQILRIVGTQPIDCLVIDSPALHCPWIVTFKLRERLF